MVIYLDSKKMWDNINVIMNKKRPSSNIEKLQVNDKNFEQPFSISYAINKYFCGVPAELASKLPKSNHRSSSYEHRKKESFRVIRVNEVEVLSLLESIDIKKSFGVDKVHPLLLSSASPIIYSPLTYDINLSLKQGSLKVAKVIPIFKQGSRSLCNNYRPISVLSALSKIFERCILNQLIFHFNTENILVSNQFGFRAGKTTTDCLVDLVDDITKAIDEGSYAVSIFLDLSKDFDTVNHSILLSKLDLYGIRAGENQWFVNGVESNFYLLKSGVPQGSILVLFLFIVYINDTARATNHFTVRFFADDTSLTAVDDSKVFLSFSLPDVDTAIANLEQDLLRVAAWCCENQLLINPDKTMFMLIATRQLRKRFSSSPVVSFLGKYLEPVASAKDLGVTLDSHLTYDCHISNVVSSCMAKLC